MFWLAQPDPSQVWWADLIVFEAKWYNVDPLLVVAIIHVESGWSPRKRSITNDYGLLQVHVSRHGSSNFYRRERELYDPRINIREGVRLLAMWKRYHNTWCKGPHAYWAHYQYGRHVHSLEWTHKVARLYRRLVKKFGTKKGHEDQRHLTSAMFTGVD